MPPWWTQQHRTSCRSHRALRGVAGLCAALFSPWSERGHPTSRDSQESGMPASLATGPALSPWASSVMSLGLRFASRTLRCSIVTLRMLLTWVTWALPRLGARRALIPAAHVPDLRCLSSRALAQLSCLLTPFLTVYNVIAIYGVCRRLGDLYHQLYCDCP